MPIKKLFKPAEPSDLSKMMTLMGEKEEGGAKNNIKTKKAYVFKSVSIN